MFAIYEKLGKLKNEDPALNGGKKPASFKILEISDNNKALAFEREKDGKKVVYMANLSKDAASFTAPVEGSYTNYMTGEKTVFAKGQKIEAKPWQYWILTN
jgi:roadblock/LC7 domain-containing protein